MLKRLPTAWPTTLYNIAATRQIEARQTTRLPAGTLMQRAGAATAHLALALAPHARHIVIACGPGNNGGDGLDAAARLHQRGKRVSVVLHADPKRLPPDAAAALQRARNAGVAFCDHLPADLAATDLYIDALLGIGASRPPAPVLAALLATMRQSPAQLLCIDVPSGLDADTGTWWQPPPFQPRSGIHTLTMLTAKPGLFTAAGRDACGTVWLADLDTLPDVAATPTAWLYAPPPQQPQPHSSHKGSWGDVAIIGGASDPTHASSMQGAALLAASAALHAGAGRVYLSLLGEPSKPMQAIQPELMLRPPAALALDQLTVVCGCGGGSAVTPVLRQILPDARQLVLDADGLNAVAGRAALQELLAARGRRDQPTVLTPHPLEAARLLDTTTRQVQSNRLAAAQTLAARFGCVVVLKGSGSVIAAPGQTPRINPTGNARLAHAGTGDVLAGFIGARLAAGYAPFDAACNAVFQHGAIADHWPAQQALTASALATSWPAAPVA